MLFKKSQLGWRLMRQSLAILFRHKKLLIFPLIGRGFFFTIIVIMSALVWIIRSGKIDYNSLTTKQVLWGYFFLILALWIGNIVSAYFNAALSFCLFQYEKNQKISLVEGLRVAGQHFWNIFNWILAHFILGSITAIFGKKLSETGFINRLFSGLNWRFASFFIPQMIIFEPGGFWQVLQRSSQLMRNFAGKYPQINYSYIWYSLFLRFFSMLPMTIGLQLGTRVWITSGITVTITLMLIIVVMVNAVFVTVHYAHYEYAANNKTIQHFRTPDLAAAIGSRKWEMNTK